MAPAGELDRIRDGAAYGASLGLEVHAGHGLTYRQCRSAIAAILQIRELNIGHFLIGEAVFVGLMNADRGGCAMLMDEAAYMILGLGNDLIDIRRIEKTIAKPMASAS